MASNTKVGITIEAKDNATSQLKDVEKSLGGLKDGFGGVMKAAALAGAAIGAGVMAIGGMAIKSASDAEQAQTSFEVMLGSAEKAQSFIADMKTFAAKTPFETTDISKAAQTFLSFGMDVEKVMPAVSMIGDVALGNKEKFSGLSLAFAQVQSTGRLMGQDLLQMVNQGFNPLQIISEKTGRSMADLKKDMEAGSISADMVTQAFKDATSEGGRFYGGMEAQSTTFAGIMSTLSDDINNKLLLPLGEKFLPVAKDLVNYTSSLVTTLSQLDFSSFSGGATGAYNSLSGLYNTVKDFAGILLEKLQPVIILAKTAFDSLLTALQPVWPELEKGKAQFMTMWPVFEKAAEFCGTIIVGAILVLVGAFVGLVLGIAKAADDIARIMGGLAEVFNGLIGFIQNIFMGQWGAAFDSLKLMVTGFGDIIFGTFGAIISFISGFVTGFIGFFQNLYDTLIGHSIIPDLVNGIKIWFAKLPTMILDGIKAFVDSIQSYFNNAKDGVLNTMNALYNEVMSIVNKIKSAMSNVQSSWANAGSNISWALGGARAVGGPVSSGASYLVGEAGPEIFTPGGSGFITPNNRMGGGVSIINYFYGVDLSPEGAERIGDSILQKVNLQLKN